MSFADLQMQERNGIYPENITLDIYNHSKTNDNLTTVTWAERNKRDSTITELHQLQRLIRTYSTESLEHSCAIECRPGERPSEYMGYQRGRKPKEDILSKRFPQLLIPKEAMAMKSHFNKQSETRLPNKADRESRTVTYCFNQKPIT